MLTQVRGDLDLHKSAVQRTALHTAVLEPQVAVVPHLLLLTAVARSLCCAVDSCGLSQVNVLLCRDCDTGSGLVAIKGNRRHTAKCFELIRDAREPAAHAHANLTSS